MAVASLVLALLWFGGVGSVLAISCGHRARRRITDHWERGSGLATAGIWLGWAGVVALTLVVLLRTTGVEQIRTGFYEMRRMLEADGPL